MAQLARFAYHQADSVSARLDRWHDAVARRVANRPWLLGAILVLTIAYEIALLARTLNLTE